MEHIITKRMINRTLASYWAVVPIISLYWGYLFMSSDEISSVIQEGIFVSVLALLVTFFRKNKISIDSEKLVIYRGLSKVDFKLVDIEYVEFKGQWLLINKSSGSKRTFSIYGYKKDDIKYLEDCLKSIGSD
jgi:hypothetical protein